MKMASLLTLIVCLLFPLKATAKNVQRANSADSVNSIVEHSSNLKIASREQAIQLVKRHYQGKVLKAQSSRVNGHPGYRIKLLSKKGVVFYVSVDAQTGRVSRN